MAAKPFGHWHMTATADAALSIVCLAPPQVVRTTVQPLHGGRASSYDAYEYVAHSHTYISDQQPTAKFSYGLSALQVRSKVVPDCM